MSRPPGKPDWGALVGGAFRERRPTAAEAVQDAPGAPERPAAAAADPRATASQDAPQRAAWRRCSAEEAEALAGYYSHLQQRAIRHEDLGEPIPDQLAGALHDASTMLERIQWPPEEASPPQP